MPIRQEQVPLTKLRDDPTEDAIWRRWLATLSRTLTGISHNALGGIQGGAAADYFHITETQHGVLLDDKSANTIYAGPATGADAAPAFRALVAADLPAGIGTVTSVGITGNDGISSSGGPITTSGNITLDLTDITPDSVAAVGTVTGSNLSGTNTGDQTISLTGDVTGSGTGSIATTIAAGAVDIAMLSATGTADSTTYLRGDNTWAAAGGGGGGIPQGGPLTQALATDGWALEDVDSNYEASFLASASNGVEALLEGHSLNNTDSVDAYYTFSSVPNLATSTIGATSGDKEATIQCVAPVEAVFAKSEIILNTASTTPDGYTNLTIHSQSGTTDTFGGIFGESITTLYAGYLTLATSGNALGEFSIYDDEFNGGAAVYINGNDVANTWSIEFYGYEVGGASAEISLDLSTADGQITLEFINGTTSTLRLTETDITLDTATILFVSQTDATGASSGTLSNAPSAGDPAFWMQVSINGTIYAIPAWTV